MSSVASPNVAHESMLGFACLFLLEGRDTLLIVKMLQLPSFIPFTH